MLITLTARTPAFLLDIRQYGYPVYEALSRQFPMDLAPEQVVQLHRDYPRQVARVRFRWDCPHQAIRGLAATIGIVQFTSGHWRVRWRDDDNTIYRREGAELVPYLAADQQEALMIHRGRAHGR